MAIQYRQSQTKLEYIFIPKDVILTPLFEKDFLSMNIDFSKYNSENFTLKPHQERSIKFLASRKKVFYLWKWVLEKQHAQLWLLLK